MSDAYGKRLVVSLIDRYSKESPERVWASVPQDESNLAKGFKDITYRNLANAVNHASWWLDASLGKSNGSFETFAYAGPKDLRFPILAVAAVKVGRQILLPSPFATREAQLHVLHVTKCQAYLHPTSMETAIENLIAEEPNIQRISVPEVHEWVNEEEAQSYNYEKSWDEAKLDPWMIFHTSGTTGLPKPITYTNFMMTSMDAARTMPDADQGTMLDRAANSRWYTPLPTLHFLGMTVALQLTVFLHIIMVVGPVSVPATAPVVSQILQHGAVEAAILPPSLLEDLCANPDSLALIRRQLQAVYFGGAPLPKAVGALISPYVKLMPAIGSTEAGGYFVEVRSNDGPDDWSYYSFRPAMGCVFEPRTKSGLYELIFRRRPEYERWQQIFHVYPDLDEFPTKDLWAKHPTREGLWEYAGRTDDLVILSHGEDLHASKMEATIEEHADVKAALIGGEGRKKPFLILELTPGARKSSGDGPVAPDDDAVIDALWPAVQNANRLCSDYVQLSKPLTMLTSPSRPFLRTAKDTVARRDSLALYGDDISALYAKAEKTTVAT
ncbi:hypothetical protein MMC07_004044 [Pseudocyphellaria aurata]|nr:hypothetical protein [Pseudocyphellaria aurata]